MNFKRYRLRNQVTKGYFVVFLLFLAIVGCSENHIVESTIEDYKPEVVPTRPDDSRLYKFLIQDENIKPIEDVFVTIETKDSNYVDLSNREGWAYIVIPNTNVLPTKTTATISSSSIMSEPVLLSGVLNTESEINIIAKKRIEGIVLENGNLHHLGDDIYSGTVNSKFQLSSEGAEISFSFYLLEIAPHGPHIRLYAKGIQWPAQILFNHNQVATLAPSPSDGSYMEYDFQSSSIVSSTLKLGLNTLTIRAADSPMSDIYDDFEFCCLMIY